MGLFGNSEKTSGYKKNVEMITTKTADGLENEIEKRFESGRKIKDIKIISLARGLDYYGAMIWYEN